MTDGLLANYHAVVTGGGRGIGAAVARSLAEHGARLTLMGRDTQRLTAFAATLGAHAVGVDVSQPDSVTAAFKDAEDQNGVISILVNNAGITDSAPFSRTDLALWERLLSVNLTGTYLCSRAAVGGMVAQKFGRIVNVASTAGLTGYAYVTAYCASKHGVIGLTRALAVELAKTGVTVNAICPGYTDTDMVTDAVVNVAQKTGRSADDIVSHIVSHNPQGRLIQPDEVANAVTWLCLPGSDSITGQTIAISGGEIF